MEANVVVSNHICTDRRVEWIAGMCEIGKSIECLERLVYIDACPTISTENVTSFEKLPVVCAQPPTKPSSEECAICCEPTRNPSSGIGKTNCKHTFCLDCLLIWMTFSDACPMCRTSVVGIRSETPHVPSSFIRKYFSETVLRNEAKYRIRKDIQNMHTSDRVCIVSDLFTSYYVEQFAKNRNVTVYTWEQLEHSGVMLLDNANLQLVVMDAKNPIQSVLRFVYDFPLVKRRTYCLTKKSIDHMLLLQTHLRSFAHLDAQKLLIKYCDFLMNEID